MQLPHWAQRARSFDLSRPAKPRAAPNSRSGPVLPGLKPQPLVLGIALRGLDARRLDVVAGIGVQIVLGAAVGAIAAEQLHVGLVQDHPEHLAGDLRFGLEQRADQRARGRPPFGDQKEAVGQLGESLGVDNRCQRRQVDDDVVEILPRRLDDRAC